MSFKVEAGLTFMSATSKIDWHVWNKRDAIVSVGIWQKISTFREITHCTRVCSLLHYGRLMLS